MRFHLLLGQWLSWQWGIPHSGVVKKGSQNNRVLHQVLPLQPIENIQVGVVRAGHVIQTILDELKARQSHPVKGEVVSASHGAHRNMFRSQILHRGKPSGKDGLNCQVFLSINAPDGTGAKINIEVGGKFFNILLQDQLSLTLLQVFGEFLLPLSLGRQQAKCSHT